MAKLKNSTDGEAPSQKDMMQPSYVERGRPNYIDKSAETPGNPFHRVEGNMDAPKYLACNPRYWEYR